MNVIPFNSRVAPVRAAILLTLMGISWPMYHLFISNDTTDCTNSVIMLLRCMYIIHVLNPLELSQMFVSMSESSAV